MTADRKHILLLFGIIFPYSAWVIYILCRNIYVYTSYTLNFYWVIHAFPRYIIYTDYTVLNTCRNKFHFIIDAEVFSSVSWQKLCVVKFCLGYFNTILVKPITYFIKDLVMPALY
jgi:hypothetical protein